ncbi:ETS-related transcription factor Elf-2 isoform X2 [Strongylocentrotus purpuratus]|uniref:ETS domain-containing protein n=1 Tax=Strongylocentrotus purpuratus TaxID=7668 RepID=A0A7M7P2A9_STRPU|nr:ETS-related transcription factor Elf-2 isoform X2 [Strongylocentrotus purpuratus]
MNAFGSDQMLLPSITQILEPDVKPITSIHQSLLSDDDLASGTNHIHRPDINKTTPKMLTPPDSPVVFSELTTPPNLLRMTLHDGSQMVSNLESVCSVLEMGLHSNFLPAFDSLESLNHITELEHLHARDIMSSTSTRSDDMFDDNDSGSDWPGIYIDDNDDTIVPSPTPSPPFDAPYFYESPDLTTIDSLLVYQEPAKPERRKYSSISTEESIQSDSGSEGGRCTPLIIPTRPFHSHHSSNKSKSASRTHNYQRRIITKSLEELREEGSKPVYGSPSSPSSSSTSSSSSSIEKRKRGRPRKRLSGELGERGVNRRKQSRKAVKGSHLWEFILNILKNEAYCPQYIRWEDKERGVFRIVNSKVVANMWGDIKNNPRMTYEKLSRAMRYYYKREILERVDKARLVYKFGEKAEGWRKVIADE